MRRQRIVDAILLLAVTAVTAVIGGLVYANWRLRSQLEMATDLLRARQNAKARLAAGDVLAPFQARDRDGRLVRVGGGEDESLLVVVDPECGSCENVLEELRAQPRMDASVVAVSRSQTPAMAKLNVANSLPLYVTPPNTSRALVRQLGGVPRVVRLGPGGLVRKVCHSVGECT